MKVLFVGLLYNPCVEDELLRASPKGLSVASNIFQWNVIRGLYEILGDDLEVAASLPIGSWPFRSKVMRVRHRIQMYRNISYKEYGFINLSLVKTINREKSFYNHILDWDSHYTDEGKCILVYDMHPDICGALLKIKNQNSGIKLIFIIPDLYGKLRNAQGFGEIKSKIISVFLRDALRAVQRADGYVFLTEQMGEVINKNRKPSIVIDGIVDDATNVQHISRVSTKQGRQRVFIYAGALMKQYNIIQLMDIFHELGKKYDIKLYLCGFGDAVEEIIRYANRDSNIRYLGFVTKEKLRLIEEDVDVYINPRTNNGEYTKYSFPSKNLEYLLAGKPVIAFKLDGMSDEYDGVFLYPAGETIESIRDEVVKVCGMTEDELHLIGQRSREFVLEHNGVKYQAERLCKFLSDIIGSQ